MEELFHLIETKGEATDQDIFNGIYKEHQMLGLMSPIQVSARLQKIIQDLKNIKPCAIQDRLQFYTLILIIILFPSLDNFVSSSFNLRNDRILFIFVTYTLRKQLQLPIRTISQIFYESIQTFSFVKPFYEIKPIYFYQRVPELLKNIKYTESSEFVKVFLNTFISNKDISNIDHSTIIYFNSMIQQCISYLIQERDDNVINQCNLFFTRIFSLQSVCPSVILLHFLHLWYIFVRFCKEKMIKVPYEPQIHLISFLFRSISSSQKHELYRFFHWDLVLNIRSKFEGTSWEFNSLCLILTFYKTIYHIESIRGMVEPSKEFLEQILDQSKGKNRFQFCTVLTFFDSCLREYINSISEFFLIVINSNSEEIQQNKVKPLKISFTDQLKCSKNVNSDSNLDLLDDYLYTIMNEKIIELSDFSLQFESLITRCELMKTRIVTANYFLFPCFKRATNSIDFLPYTIQITKTLMKVVIHINQAIFSIQYINVTPNKNPDLLSIIVSITDTLKDAPFRTAPYISITIAKMLFKKCRKFKLTRLTIDFLCSLPDHILNLLIKDMIQIVLTNKNMFFAKEFEKTFLICRFTILTARIISAQKRPELEKELIPVFQKILLRSIFTNLRKISNQNIVFEMINIFIKHFKLNFTCFPAKPSYLEDVMIYAKKDFLFGFLSLLPNNNDHSKAQIFNNIYEFALKYGDQESINIASKYCINLFTSKDKQQQISNEYHYISLYQAWKNANLTSEDRDKMISTIPFYSDAFILNKTNELHENLSFNDVYCCIYNSISNDPDSVIIAFSIFQNSILNPDLKIEEAKSLFTIFMRCLAFNFMKEKINMFTPIMLKYHVDLFLRGITNVFFLSLIEVSSTSISYLSHEMHDLGIAFMELVVLKDPECPMIPQTIDQILSITPKNERVISLLSATSIFIRCCPKFVPIELIRAFILASNDLPFIDRFISQSITDLLEKYVSVIDEETTQKFIECIFILFSTVRISFRIPILQVLSKIKCRSPHFEFYKDSNFICLELQKMMLTLLCDSKTNTAIIENAKKCILEKNDTSNSQERLSRRFSLVYSSIANESNLMYFAEDQSFFQKLTNFINNSMISIYKELRTEAKMFLETVLVYFDKRKKSMNQQFDNHIELFGDRIERIMYFKRLIKIKPEMIQVKLILDIIAAIGNYTARSEDEKNIYLHNLKIFYSFLGSKHITQINGLEEGLASNVESHVSYFTHFIDNYHKLSLEGQFPYQTIILKPSFNFLLNFPEKTLASMIDSYQGQQYYTTYINLLDFKESSVFHDHFIALCKNKHDPFSYPLHYFEIIVKMSTIESCVQNNDFMELIEYIFNQIAIRFDNITNNLYFMLFRMITALTNTFKFVEDINRFVLLLKSFDLPLLYNSSSYRKIIKKCIKKASQQFKFDLIRYFINNPGIVKNSTYDIALQHLIKQSKEIPEEMINDLWIFLSNSGYVSSILRLLQHNVPSDEIIKMICMIISTTMMESNTDLIIHSIKLMIQLGKIGKLPADIYWSYIKQSLYTFKFMDIPFSKYTFQMLKLMKDHFPIVPPDLSDAFSLFIHNKCSSIRETQRIVEILLCAPPLTRINCFSPLIILTSFLSERFPKRNELPQKASFDCILNVGIKYISMNEVPEAELNKYFSICYKYLELMVLGMPYSTFFDKISNYMNDHDLPNPPESLLNEILNEQNKFMLPSFISLCIFMKKQPDEYLKYPKLIKRALDYIHKSNDFINAVTLQFFTELVCKKEEYVSMVYSIYDSLINSDLAKNEQKAFQIMFSIMKANVLNYEYEKMWDLLIEREKKEAYTFLNENEQIRYTEYIISKCTNHELFIIQSANVFLDSKKVSKHAQILLITNLASFINNYNSDLILNCIDKIERFGASIQKDFKSEIADILIEAARCSTYLFKMKYIRKLLLLVPKEKNEKLNFVFNHLPVLLWRNDTLIFILSVFATDLKKWLPLFAFGNSYQSILSDFVIYFLRDYICEETIKLFSDFFSKVLSIDDKDQFSGIINGLSYIFFSTNYPIHSKIFSKADKEIIHPEYMIDFLNTISTFSESVEYFLPHYMNDFIFGKFGCRLNVAERAVMSLTLLSKFNTAADFYYQIESHTDNKLYDLFREINEDESRFWSFISQKNFYFNSAVDEINKTSSNFEEQNYQSIEKLLDQAHQQLVLEYQKNMSFFKDELFVSVEAAIQIEKYLINQQNHENNNNNNNNKVSLGLLMFTQTINPFLLSMLSNFKDEIKALLKFPRNQQPKIEYDLESPPVLSVPSSYIKKFKKISGITSRGLFAVNVEQINDFLTSIKMTTPPCMKDLIKLSPILFEIYRISPCDDLYKAVYCSYSLLININIDVPLFIRQQAGARLLLLLQFANTKAHFDVIRFNSIIFEKKDFDIWRLWLLQLVILSKKNELRDLLLPLYVEMGYRSLLYARQLNIKEIESFLINRIPPSLIPLGKLGEALDIVFENKGFENDYDRILSLLNESFPFPLPLYKIQMTIYRISGETKYLSDQLVLLTYSTSIDTKTPILIQKYEDPKSSISPSLKTFHNTLYIMNLIIRFSYPTKIRNMSLSSPFLFEIGDYYLMTIIKGETLYMKELFDQAEKLKETGNGEDDQDESDFLLNYISRKCSKFDFIVNRNYLLRSWSSQGIVRHIFSIGYPHLEKMAIYLNQGIAPLLTIDYEKNILWDNLVESSIRYSPNFYRLFGGDSGIPVFQTGIAAVACSFIENLESIRSYLEILFFDRLFNSSEEDNEDQTEEVIFDTLVKKRTEVEEKVLNSAPPSGRAASTDDLIEWMNGMDSLVKKSMDEMLQPPSACPWF